MTGKWVKDAAFGGSFPKYSPIIFNILSEVERLCDRVGIIREGKLVETGTLSELRHLARITMNFETEPPVEGPESMKGVYELRKQKGGLSFQMDSVEIGHVVAHISKGRSEKTRKHAARAGRSVHAPLRYEWRHSIMRGCFEKVVG